MDCEAPATRADIEVIVADARRIAPLNVPLDAVERILASGATPTQARARLFEMVWGHSATEPGRPMAAHLMGGRA